ncbi:MAG: chemotaxis protein CheX [Nitrospirae bacterium]|nr:chemotaxis protein CheX [Nitrospirota bacterium]
MNVEMVNPFLVSLMNVLSTMAQVEAIMNKPTLKQGDRATGDVTGFIGLTSTNIKGSLAITFTESAIIQIASQMLGEVFEIIDESVIDAVGEITNMVSGGAKKILSEKGYKFNMAIPSVISGKDHIITHNTKGAIVLVPFETQAGSLFVEVCFEG